MHMPIASAIEIVIHDSLASAVDIAIYESLASAVEIFIHMPIASAVEIVKFPIASAVEIVIHMPVPSTGGRNCHSRANCFGGRNMAVDQIDSIQFTSSYFINQL